MLLGSRWGGLRAKIIAWSFFPTALILAAVALVGVVAYQQVAESLTLESSRELARLSAAQLSGEMGQYAAVLDSIGRTADMTSGGATQQQAALQRAANRLVIFDAGVVMLDGYGVVRASSPRRAEIAGQDWSNRTYYRQMMRAPASVYSHVVTDGPAYTPAIVVAVPVNGPQGEFLGCLLGMFSISPRVNSSFYGSIVKLRLGGAGNAYVVDNNGLVIYHTEVDRIGRNYSTQTVIRRVISGEAGVLRTQDLTGQDVLASYAPVPNTAWGLVVEQPWDAVLAPGRGYGQMLLALLILGVLIPAGVVTLGVRHVTQPVQTLIAATRAVAGGNFGQQVSINTGDELQELARQFNHMSAQLSESYSALKSREERLALMMAGTNDGFWDWDVATNLVYFSPRWKSMLGYAEDEIENSFDAWRCLLHPDDAARASALLQQYLDGAIPVYELEHRLRCKDGSYRWILARGLAFRDNQGRAVRMAGSHTDITERKLVQDQIKRQNEYLAALHQTTLGVIGHLDTTEVLEEIVSRAVGLVGSLFGWVYLVTPEGDLEARVGTQAFQQHLGSRLAVGDGLAGAVAAAGALVVVDDYMTWPGRDRRYEGQPLGPGMGVPLTSASGLGGVIGMVRAHGERPFNAEEVDFMVRFGQLASIALDNATLHTSLRQELETRTRTQEALRTSESRFRGVFENADIGIAIFDMQNRPLEMNLASQRIVGYTLDEVAGMDMAQYTHPDDVQPHLALEAEIVAGKRTSYEITKRYIHRDGRLVWAHLTQSLSPGPAAGPQYMIAVLQDITEKKLADQRLEEAYQSLERRVQDRTRELSTLLEIVKAASGTLDQDQVLRHLAQGMARALGVPSCGMYLLDEAASVFVPRTGAASLPVTDPEQRAALSQPLDPRTDAFVRAAVESRRPVFANDAQTDPLTDHALAKRLHLRSCLAVPLVSKDRVVALAMVSSFDEILSVSEEQVEMAVGIVNAAGIALENAQLYAETRKRADEIQTLFTVQQAITRRLDPDAVLQIIADEARRLTGARGALVLMPDEDELVVSITSNTSGSSGASAAADRAELLGARIPATADPDADLARLAHTDNLVTVPLAGAGGPVGFIAAVDRKTGRFGPEDQRVMALLASGAVIALENARLYRDEQARRREADRRREVAEGLRDILAVLNSDRQLEEILNYIVTQAGRVLEADAAASYHLERDSGSGIAEAVYGMPEQLGDIRATPFSMFRSMDFYQAIFDRQPFAVTDLGVRAGPGPSSPPATEEPQAWVQSLSHLFRAYISAPVIVADQVYGCMTFYYTEPREFPEDVIRLAMALADQAGLAIENARLRAQAEEVAIAAERNRLARDLHDAVTQTLFSASIIADVLPRLWDRNPEECRRRLDELRQLTRGALAEMRTLLLELRPATLAEAALPDLLRQLAEAVAGRARIPVLLSVDTQARGGQLPADVKVAVYRIAQEALNNVFKHSGAQNAAVSLRLRGRELTLTITDDGHGFDPALARAGSLGLGIMRERAEAVGAQLSVTSAPGHGTTVAVTWREE